MATYNEEEVYCLINKAIVWNMDNKSTPLVDWWDENKKSESPTPIVGDVIEAAEEYVRSLEGFKNYRRGQESGGNRLHKSFLAGAAYRDKQEEPVVRDEFIEKHLTIIRQKTMDSMIELHIVRKRDSLRPSIQHFLSGGNCNGMFREAILSMLNTAYKWKGDQPC